MWILKNVLNITNSIISINHRYVNYCHLVTKTFYQILILDFAEKERERMTEPGSMETGKSKEPL